MNRNTLESIGTWIRLSVERSLSVGLETNGKGFHGYLVELPGAFVRGSTEKQAVSKIPSEAESYLHWLGLERSSFPEAQIVQRHQCRLMVEDADNEILLHADRDVLSPRGYRDLVELVRFSGITFTLLYESAVMKDWVDEARDRRTFYGTNKKTIREIHDHVKRTQHYYLSRLNIPVVWKEREDFMEIRESYLDKTRLLLEKNDSSRVYVVDDEEWTLKKVLRRFVWHDRIHGKAITRILEKQRGLGVIGDYVDPFRFDLHSA